MRTLVLCILFLMANKAEATTALEWVPLKSLDSNKEATEGIKNKNYPKAFDSSTQGLQSDPFRFEHHMNIALALEGQGEMDRATKAYEAAQKYAETPEQKFVAAFNLGQIYGKAKKVDEAIEAYQKALDVNPSSIETKHNIELLIQQSQGQGQGEKNKDQQQQGGSGQDQNQQQEQNKDQKEDEKKKDEPKNYADSPKYKPRDFKGQELSEGDVKQILNELKQQEQRIRGEFNRKERKEAPLEKDW